LCRYLDNGKMRSAEITDIDGEVKKPLLH